MVTSSLPGSKKREHRSGCSRLFSSHEKSPDEFLTAAALHRSQRFAHLGEALLYRRAGLDVGPPCREFRMSVERDDPEDGHQVGHEEHRRRERTIGEREVGAAREAASGEHLFELVEAVFEVGHLLADKLFVASLRIHLVEQRTQRRLEIEVVESGQDSHFGAALGALGKQRRSRVLVLEILVDDLGLGDEQAVGFERRGFTERIDLRVFGGVEIAAGNRRHLYVESLFVDDEPALGGEVGEIHVVELHRSRFLAGLNFKLAYRRRPRTTQATPTGTAGRIGGQKRILRGGGRTCICWSLHWRFKTDEEQREGERAARARWVYF